MKREEFDILLLRGENRKSSMKTDERILQVIKTNDKITISELSKEIGVSTRAIEKQLEKLKAENRINRIEPDRGGFWQVVE